MTTVNISGDLLEEEVSPDIGFIQPTLVSLFGTKKQMYRKARSLAGAGYGLYPSDTPQKGICGIWACPLDDGDRGTQYNLEWAQYDKVLEPQVVAISAKHYMFLATHAQGSSRRYPWQICDDPRKLLMGLVRHDPIRGKAIVRTCHLRQVKALPPEERTWLLQWREEQAKILAEEKKQALEALKAIERSWDVRLKRWVRHIVGL